MNEFVLQPGLYSTGGSQTLFDVLNAVWPKGGDPIAETYYLVSGFGSFNGGVSFFERLRAHVDAGGRVRAIFAGSRSTNVTSLQLVEALLDCGAEVHIVNRRYLMHSKLYGKTFTGGGQQLVVTSGNFTGPGIARNIESLVSLDEHLTAAVGFEWDLAFDSMLNADLDVFTLNDAQADDPRWTLLYDESKRSSRKPAPEDDEDVFESLIMTLSHSDTARIMAAPGTDAARGTQYFWLSKDSYAFFPPLTIRSARGHKATYSCLIDVTFTDLGVTSSQRVTYEAENNLDFRLGTASLRGTKIAQKDDMVVLSRRGEASYDLQIVKAGTPEYFALGVHATAFIGAQGKRYGFALNSVVDKILAR